MQKTAGITPNRQSLISFETEQRLLVLPELRHRLALLVYRNRFSQGLGKDYMDDFSREQSQPDGSFWWQTQGLFGFRPSNATLYHTMLPKIATRKVQQV